MFLLWNFILLTLKKALFFARKLLTSLSVDVLAVSSEALTLLDW